MKIKVTLKSDSDIVLPIGYNRHVQGFIYENIDRNLACFLHDEGYIHNGRKFKLFSFSNLFGEYEVNDNLIKFKDKVSLVVTSPVDEFCKSISNELIMSGGLVLGRNKLKLDNIELVRIESQDSMIISTLSPIVAYSTLGLEDSKKYTKYFRASEAEFERIVKENLLKKYKVLYGRSLENAALKIEPLGATKQKFIYYKNFLIKGETGKFKIIGNKELIKIGLEAGFGSKNSQGFGCVE